MRVLQKIFGLFVDDGLLAASILGWIVTSAALAHTAVVNHVDLPDVLFVAVAVIFVPGAGRAGVR